MYNFLTPFVLTFIQIFVAVDATQPHAFVKGYMSTEADHRLMVDNIMDLSHADYLHPDSLGGGSITRTKPVVQQTGDTVSVRWLVRNERALPVFQSEMPSPDAKSDMWIEVHWHPSGAMLLRAGATPAGTPPERGIDTHNAHIMTPESHGRTHYFYCSSRNYRTRDPEFNAFLAATLRSAFEREDRPMVEGQQRRIGVQEFSELKPALMSIDVAASRVREIYDRLLAREQGAHQGTPRA